MIIVLPDFPVCFIVKVDRITPFGATYADIAAKLDMSEGAVKVAVYRLRKRYRAVFRARVLETVADEREVEEEIQFFFKALES